MSVAVSEEVSVCADEGPCLVPPVLDIRLERAPTSPLPRLFVGELSSYDQARADNQELPKTLSSRLVHLQEDAERLAFKAGILLEPATIYTLVVAPSESRTLEVEALEPGELFQRVWPAENEGSRFAVYCTDDHSPVDDGELAGLEWRSLPAEGCVLLSGGADGVVLPSKLGERWVEPAMLPAGVEHTPNYKPPHCHEPDAQLLLGCARVQDDRVELVPEHEGVLVVRGVVELMVFAEAGIPVVLKGFAPRSAARLQVEAWLRSGVGLRETLTVFTTDAQPRVILNEVLANPNGPEPQQEWVELFNAGTKAVDLQGWHLTDVGGSSELPAYRLLPGEHVLVVREDFDARAAFDVVPKSNTGLLRVAALGQSGLSNSGEPLKLYDRTGVLRSFFPAIASQPGHSIARATPDVADHDSAGFSVHEEPGASPGNPNAVR